MIRGHVGVSHGIGPTGIERIKRRAATFTAVCALAVGLGSCAGSGITDQFDPAAGATKKDYESLIGRKGQDKLDKSAAQPPPIPQFQSVLAAPSAPELADTRRVSLSVTETTPVRDILIELARKAEVDLELDPRISGGVIMSVTDRPFVDVIERIIDLAELRYTLDKNVLKVELDDPYLEQYRMDVLNQTRNSTSTISSSTDASSTNVGTGGGGGGGNNKSESSVDSSSTNDFWASIGTNIGQILTNIQSRRGEAASDIRKTQFEAPAEDDGDDEDKAGRGNGLIAQAGAISKGRQEGLDANIAADRGEESPDEDEDGKGDKSKAMAAGGAVGGGGAVAATNFSLNPQAGIITVFANKRQQAAIEKYLRNVRISMSQQILIEAKILEIALNDQYRTGVNWQAFLGPNGNTIGGNNSLLSADTLVTGNFGRSVTADTGTPTIGIGWTNSDRDLSIAAQLVKQFGTVRTLSSPRLTVLNNQAAVLKVARNQIFFELDVTTTDATTTAAAKTTVNSEIKSVPVGLILNVLPNVDPVTRRIGMNIRPSITRISGFVADPGVAVAVAQAAAQGAQSTGISSQIPIIDVREMDSLVNMDSGQTIVMGGLMQENSENSREGLPLAMDIPLLGNAVSQNLRGSTVTELVVFIRATIVENSGSISEEDIRLYKTFTPDPRPIAF
jgi:MSHA biogenesis protein MshL